MGTEKKPKENATPVTPLPASSILLVRDGPLRADGKRLEVLMIERHGAMRVAGGAYVFPGGKVDACDHSLYLRRRLMGLRDVAFRLSAIREAFEETGVVLARSRLGKRYSGRPPISAAMQAELVRYARRMGDLRRKMEADFQGLLAAYGLIPAVDALIPFSHWITPEVRRYRFDTRFYLAATPKGQTVIHDGGEAVKAFWARPGEILAAHGRDVEQLMFPTRTCLQLLDRAGSVTEALELARRRPRVPIMPRLSVEDGSIWAHVPEEAGLGGSRLWFGPAPQGRPAGAEKPQKA